LPERQNFDRFRGVVDLVVQVVAHTSQEHASELVDSGVTDWLSGFGEKRDQSERFLEILREGFRRLRAVLPPPPGSLADLSFRLGRYP
jgi:hypothetical protein